MEELSIFSAFQRSIDHGHHVIELLACRNAETSMSATFVYEKAPNGFQPHFTDSDENEVIRQAI